MLEAIGYEPSGPNGVYVFLVLTLILGAAAAWRTGQAVASGWGPIWPIALYAALLACALRFLNYALFQGPLLSISSFAIDFLILLAIALLAHRAKLTLLMTEQYPWAFARTSPLSWRARNQVGNSQP